MESATAEINIWPDLETRAQELTQKEGRKVMPFSLIAEDDSHIKGYMYEPNDSEYDELIVCRINGGKQALEAAIKHIDALILWNESDPAMKNKENLIGAAIFLLMNTKVPLPETKKS